MSKRLAVLTSHPIHYQAPLWRLLAADPDIRLTVFFRSDIGLRPYHDAEFNKTIQWDLPLVEGYEHIFLKSTFDLLVRLWRGHYDALLVHAWNSPATWLAVLWAKLLGIRTMLRAESPWNQEADKSGWKHELKKALLQIFFAGIDRFLYIGEQNRRLYLNYGISERKLFFTPYAIENERFFADAKKLRDERDKLRAEMGLPKDATVFLSVGKLIDKKRHMDMLAAYVRISSPQKALVIVGEGELRPSLEKYIEEHKLQNVHFPGFKGQTEISPYYAAADAFVLPSGPGETWGLVVNEAMCFGLPLIVSDIVGSAVDLVQVGKNGYVFPMGDVDALTKAMEELARDPVRRAAFGKKSREIVEGYSYEKDVEGIKKVL